MEITFPHTKAPDNFVHGNIEESIYVVLCCFQCGRWGFADFSSLPYTDRHYLAAVAMKDRICKSACKHSNAWKKSYFKVAKITL